MTNIQMVLGAVTVLRSVNHFFTQSSIGELQGISNQSINHAHNAVNPSFDQWIIHNNSANSEYT